MSVKLAMKRTTKEPNGDFVSQSVEVWVETRTASFDPTDDEYRDALARARRLAQEEHDREVE